MSQSVDTKKSGAVVPLWIIAGLLLVLILGGGGYLWKRHHDAGVRDGYRQQAELYCSLEGEAELAGGRKQCVENQIDALVANDGDFG